MLTIAVKCKSLVKARSAVQSVTIAVMYGALVKAKSKSQSIGVLVVFIVSIDLAFV